MADGIRELVDAGALRPGERLPATRPLAVRWGWPVAPSSPASTNSSPRATSPRSPARAPS
ncbi:hypothetical protein G7085_09915 [Tessaracoccus sp. HDW20]|nr:hypothetical protein [Tessaracoccus coleopterorum]